MSSSISQLSSSLVAREPDSKWYAVEIIDKNSRSTSFVPAPEFKQLGLIHFLAGCCKEWLNQTLSVFCFFFECILCVFTRATLSIVCYLVFLHVLSQLFRFSCQYLPIHWLERLQWWNLWRVKIISTKTTLKSELYLFYVVVCPVSVHLNDIFNSEINISNQRTNQPVCLLAPYMSTLCPGKKYPPVYIVITPTDNVRF